ncbi:hypothetical protein [Paractinoplanes hotanensis]|uniref:Uncharacterized protein n=1 Tax=Paractinoplanes hotanensis TaxID=2906497 RepID=A0ABT0XXG9_9ACTN|nr:hypothetical protein [Actinoplanes hotanensis]MCM4078320.1 hypothetical protein [Actinoplanes hotanensis]
MAESSQPAGELFGRGVRAQPCERTTGRGLAGRLPDGVAEPTAAQELGVLLLVFSARPDAFYLADQKRVERLRVVRRGQGGAGGGGANLEEGAEGLGGGDGEPAARSDERQSADA